MKLFAYIGLVIGASALQLNQHHATSLIQSKVHQFQHPATLLKTKTKQTAKKSRQLLQQDHMNEMWAEIEAWATAELSNGGTITKEEAWAKAQEYADRYGFEIPQEMKDYIESIFDMIDTDGNGEIDAKEAEAAYHGYAEQNYDHVQYPTQEDVMAWIEAELAKDGDITLEEATAAIQHWAESQGVTLPAEVWEGLEQGFNMVDTNGDQRLTRDEIEAAMAHAQEHHDHGNHTHGNNTSHHGGSCPYESYEDQLRDAAHRFMEAAPDLTEEQSQEWEQWIDSELQDNGTITQEEAYHQVMEFASKHGLVLTDEFWQALSDLGSLMDINQDNQIDAHEWAHAMEVLTGGHHHEHHEEDTTEHKKPKCKAKALREAMKRFEEVAPDLNEEQTKEIEEWIMNELSNNGTITGEEVWHALHNFAEKHGFELDEEFWVAFGEVAELIDVNGDMQIDNKEWARAMRILQGGQKQGGDKKKKESKKERKQRNKKYRKEVKKAMRKLTKVAPKLSEEQYKEIEEWMTNELSNGPVTSEQVWMALQNFATQHDLEFSEEFWTALSDLMSAIDTNNDMAISKREWARAVKVMEGKKKSDKQMVLMKWI